MHDIFSVLRKNIDKLHCLVHEILLIKEIDTISQCPVGLSLSKTIFMALHM